MATATPVYTVSDESRYLIVKNVPALGCIEELVKLFGSYGPIEEYRLMDEEDCEPFTDIYWIKFVKISNARFAKRKLDNLNFLGNLLQVTYAPMYETPLDTKDKLEERRNVLLNRIRSEKQGHLKQNPFQPVGATVRVQELISHKAQLLQPNILPLGESGQHIPPQTQYFPSVSMNATVQAVRQKLNQISGSGEFFSKPNDKRQVNDHGHLSQIEAKPAEKKPRIDNRRRI